MERKNFLRSLGLLAAGTMVPLKGKSVVTINEPLPTKQRSMRIAHLTDAHIADNKNARNGFIKCLHAIQQMEDTPDYIINGGDTIEDALYNTKSNVNKQWDLWHSILKNECSIKVNNTIGNHDIWGLYTEKKDFLYGKKFAQEKLHMEHTYYSVDQCGWHIIFLDSTQKKSNGMWYTAKLGEEQIDWLSRDLAATPANTPVLVVSHIPILCANIFLDNVKQRFGKFQIPSSWMHTDVQEIVSLFNQYPNVKLCISGHIHLQDKVQYNNVMYCCNGAVSGDWWRNEYYHQTKAGYAIIDLFSDGTFENNYMHYA